MLTSNQGVPQGLMLGPNLFLIFITCARCFTLLICEFSAKIGSKRDEAETAIEQYGLRERNERGSALIEFLYHNLYVMNNMNE